MSPLLLASVLLAAPPPAQRGVTLDDLPALLAKLEPRVLAWLTRQDPLADLTLTTQEREQLYRKQGLDAASAHTLATDATPLPDEPFQPRAAVFTRRPSVFGAQHPDSNKLFLCDDEDQCLLLALAPVPRGAPKRFLLIAVPELKELTPKDALDDHLDLGGASAYLEKTPTGWKEGLPPTKTTECTSLARAYARLVRRAELKWRADFDTFEADPKALFGPDVDVLKPDGATLRLEASGRGKDATFSGIVEYRGARFTLTPARVTLALPCTREK